MTDIKPRETVIENLKDAGCSGDFIENFMTFFENGNVKQQVELLENHRKQLLKKVHEKEKCISCLDYLVYQLMK